MYHLCQPLSINRSIIHCHSFLRGDMQYQSCESQHVVMYHTLTYAFSYVNKGKTHSQFKCYNSCILCLYVLTRFGCDVFD